jgi:Tfp pilus assembly protein PilX
MQLPDSRRLVNIKSNYSLTATTVNRSRLSDERGAALATAVLLLAVLGAIAMTVLSVATSETHIAASDLHRTQTFYAAAASMEKMSSDFAALFARTARPTRAQLDAIEAASPIELFNEGFTLNQTIAVDNRTLAAMQQTTNTANPRVTISNGPFAGMTAGVTPYILSTTATAANGSQVNLTRQINNYLVPVFQFGMFSSEDLEVHPGPKLTFNGRVHANGNLYLNGDVTFLAKATTANEVVSDVLRNGSARNGTVSFQVGPINVPLTQGSVVQGPNLLGAALGQRGYFPGSPDGTSNANWATISVAAAQSGIANQFGGQLLTRLTGVTPLLLPMQLTGNQTREIIKRRMLNDDNILSQSRYHSKAQIRILLDDENPATADSSGIPAGKGVKLSMANAADPYYFQPQVLDGGRALWRIADNGTYSDNAGTAVLQGGSGQVADTVRSVRNPVTPDTSANGRTIPGGSGISGRILIEIIDANGNAFDVTRQILSMGVTEGEPNGIVYLQRPLWAAFTQGSRDSGGGASSLTSIMNSNIAADGEIAVPVQDPVYGFLAGIVDNAVGQPTRADSPPAAPSWNAIVPINLYNVREGRLNIALNANTAFERGLMSIVEINMRNLARWVDGVYDANLLAGTSAVSTSVNGVDGYIVYVSDRRGDRVKSEIDSSGAAINTTNGMVDNEDIYGPNGALDPGEDVIDGGIDVATGAQKKGTLQNDTNELPDPVALLGTSGLDRLGRAQTVASWLNPSNYFRRGVRLFNGENLQISGGANKLSTTKGITVSSENMVYIWGNYNTTGINAAPPNGVACLNDPAAACRYLGNQIPASIVADAVFPLSKTWFDSSSALYPDDLTRRLADLKLPGFSSETSVRAGIIAGNNLSALAGNPDGGNTAESRLNGGIHNFPRFLEVWNARWNFVGSLIPLFHSTQALGQYNAASTIYSPPIRDWAFDSTFQDPMRLPPGTPQFQYILPTAFRQVL